MSKKHLEDALQAGHQISAGQPHGHRQHRQQQQQQQPHHRTPTSLVPGPSIAGSPEDEGLFGLCYVDEDRRLVVGTGAEGLRCIAADFAIGGEATALAEAVTVKQNQPFGGLAVACVRGIRSQPGVILAAATSGYVYKADWSSPGFSTVITERGNHLSAVDTTDDHLATVGSDCTVRIYDLRTCQPVRQYSGYRDLDPDCPEGHATRLFAARFNADGLLLTSGWDDCVKFWDLRLASSDPVRRLSGPHICCPDGLDVKGNRVLTGSYRAGSALQLWDARQCEAPLASWPADHVYCARFAANSTVAAAGALSRCVTVWSTAVLPAAVGASEAPPPEPLARQELDSAVYSLAAAEDGRLAAGCHSGRLQLAKLG